MSEYPARFAAWARDLLLSLDDVPSCPHADTAELVTGVLLGHGRAAYGCTTCIQRVLDDHAHEGDTCARCGRAKRAGRRWATRSFIHGRAVWMFGFCRPCAVALDLEEAK